MDYIIEKIHECYQSYDLDGNKLIFSGSKWECEFWTEEYLNNNMKNGRIVNNGTVGGKL